MRIMTMESGLKFHTAHTRRLSVSNAHVGFTLDNNPFVTVAKVLV